MLSYRRKRILFVLCIFLLGILSVSTACAKKEGKDQPAAAPEKNKKTIVFADAGWDSIRFHNDVARFIIEKGYGYAGWQN